MKTEDIRINGGKSFLLVLGNAALVGSYNGSNDRIFVDISTTCFFMTCLCLERSKRND